MPKTEENFWLCLTNLGNWRVITKEQIYGFNEQNKKFYEFLKIHDKIIIYVIPKMIGGLYEISNLNYTGDIKLPDGKYPYRTQLKNIIVPDEPIEVTEKIVEGLSIFRNKVRWGTLLMGRSIIKIPKSDYNYIKKVIKDVKEKQDL